MFINILLIVLGFAMLKYGAEFLVDGSSSIARKFRIPSIVIGLTIVSIGTSMPELMVSASSAMSGHPELALGNVVGSNLANMLLILGICAMIAPLPCQRHTAHVDSPIMLFVTILVFIFCNYFGGKCITRIEGIVLLLITAGYIIYNIFEARKSIQSDNESNEEFNAIKAIALVVMGIVLLKYGGDFVCDNAVAIASKLGVSEKLIGITIVSVATSLPELVTSLTATRKGDVDIAIGNILGSNIFNICLIIGTAAAISPMSYALSYNLDFYILIASSAILCIFPFIKKRYEMTRIQGLLFFICYLGYIAISIFRG